MKVQVNPERLAADPDFKVFHPDSRRAFPAGPFDLSEADQGNPRVLRLLPPPGQPGGVAGGVHADLVPVIADTAKPKK